MSHQLKTPLAGLMMYREMLEDEGLDEETRKRFLAKMKGQSEKIDWILQSLFKMVNLESGGCGIRGRRRCLYRKRYWTRWVQCLTGRNGETSRILTESFEDRMLWHNRKWTAEVLVNLLENAVKYTEPGGYITISVNRWKCIRRSRSATRAEGSAGGTDRDIQAVLPEPGCGEHRGLRDRLYLSRLILEHEKGYITAESEMGRGE